MSFKISGRVIMLGWMGVALVAGMTLASCKPASWNNPPAPLHSGVQPADPPLQSGRAKRPTAVLDGLAGCFVEGVPLAPECLEHAPRCPYEDGDPSGWPCLWINPRTQKIYYVSSHEYWD